MELLTVFLNSIQAPAPKKKKTKKINIDWCNVAGGIMGTVIFTVLIINMK
jgi:hypothetical protein